MVASGKKHSIFYTIFILPVFLCVSDFPCEVGLLESVDNLVEPTAFAEFANFSLQYIDQEDNNSVGLRFAGHQTLDERERSFNARNQTLHCGFVKGPAGSPSTGFDFEKWDQIYVSKCKVVVSSCIFGSSDFLRRPTSKRVKTKFLFHFLMLFRIYNMRKFYMN